MNATPDIAALSFEECFERLEQVISRLEAGDLALDQSVALYEEGMRLAEYCGQKLDDAQIRVTQLLTAASRRADQVGEQHELPDAELDADVPGGGDS